MLIPQTFNAESEKIVWPGWLLSPNWVLGQPTINSHMSSQMFSCCVHFCVRDTVKKILGQLINSFEKLSFYAKFHLLGSFPEGVFTFFHRFSFFFSFLLFSIWFKDRRVQARFFASHLIPRHVVRYEQRIWLERDSLSSNNFICTIQLYLT